MYEKDTNSAGIDQMDFLGGSTNVELYMFGTPGTSFFLPLGN
jgi:hypothetical protein